MIIEVKVPQLSESVAEATLLQWNKKPGEAVKRIDEILIEIETDKVVLEVPAPSRRRAGRASWCDGGNGGRRRGDRADRHRRQGGRCAPCVAVKKLRTRCRTAAGRTRCCRPPAKAGWRCPPLPRSRPTKGLAPGAGRRHGQAMAA